MRYCSSTGTEALRSTALSLVLALTALCCSGAGEVRAQPREAAEYEVKAAFLYNFSKFVEWPASSFPREDSSLAICILGEDRFGRSLDVLHGRTTNSRRIIVRRIDGNEEIRSCHILFVSDSEAKQLGPIHEAARSRHVLTVSDMRHYASSGGMIGLFTENEKVRFSINAAEAAHAGLTLSSQLLKLAVMVIE